MISPYISSCSFSFLEVRFHLFSLIFIKMFDHHLKPICGIVFWCVFFISLVGDVSLLPVSLQCACISSMLVSIMEWWKFSWTSCLQHKSTRINWGSTGITGTFVKLLWILCHCTLLVGVILPLAPGEIILASWSHVLIWQFNHYSYSGDQSWSSVCPRSFILNPVSLSVCFLQK